MAKQSSIQKNLNRKKTVSKFTNRRKELKKKGKYNETDKRVPDGKPKFLNSRKRSGFKHDWR